ncbi:MAG: hypothetical protein H0W86_00870 [Armatimonadetes bacterium]|nr:hypothetical protein [Armatimonadota bacterium]
MTLLLTILSALGLWALLIILIIGLFLIYKVLDSVRRSLEQIAMGVRAIDSETKPFAEYGTRSQSLLTEASAAFRRSAEALSTFDPAALIGRAEKN